MEKKTHTATEEIPLIETDYHNHQENPGPAPEAVFEEDEEGAGKALKWVIPPLVLVLLIVWLLLAFL